MHRMTEHKRYQHSDVASSKRFYVFSWWQLLIILGFFCNNARVASRELSMSIACLKKRWVAIIWVAIISLAVGVMSVLDEDDAQIAHVSKTAMSCSNTTTYHAGQCFDTPPSYSTLHEISSAALCCNACANDTEQCGNWVFRDPAKTHVNPGCQLHKRGIPGVRVDALCVSGTVSASPSPPPPIRPAASLRPPPTYWCTWQAQSREWMSEAPQTDAGAADYWMKWYYSIPHVPKWYYSTPHSGFEKAFFFFLSHLKIMRTMREDIFFFALFVQRHCRCIE